MAYSSRFQAAVAANSGKKYGYTGRSIQGPITYHTLYQGKWMPLEEKSRLEWEQQQKMENEYETARNEAKAANESRYAEMMQGYQNLQDNVMGQYAGAGEAEKDAIRRQYGIVQSRSAQDLINSGLHSTTIAPAVRRQIAGQEARDIALLDERLRRDKLGMQTSLEGQRLAAMERRQDTYPDFNMLIQLARGLGNA